MKKNKFINKYRQQQDEKEATFKYDGGVREFVEHINKSKTPLHKTIYFTKTKDNVELEIAMQYVNSYQEKIFTFAKGFRV